MLKTRASIECRQEAVIFYYCNCFLWNPFQWMRALPFHFSRWNFHEKQQKWAPWQLRKYFGPQSKGAICPRALCQQFSHITLSTTSLWSRHGCSSNACSEWRLVTEIVGGERYNLGLASALMWAKASADYSSPVFCAKDCFVPLGIHPAEISCPLL